MPHPLAALITAAVLTTALTPAAIWVLRRLRVLDLPNDRSLHSGPTVRGGGIAIAFAVVSVVLLGGDLASSIVWGVAAGAAAFGCLGLVDDLCSGMATVPRLTVQVFLAAAAAPVLLLSGNLPILWAVGLSIPAIVCVVGYVNAFNFMDGVNGISALQATVVGVAFAVFGRFVELAWLVSGGLLLAGACLGFLPYNFPRARTFLGDAGSYFIGAWIALLAVAGIGHGLPLDAVAGVLAIYIGDTVSTILHRASRGEPWLEAHRDHAYQRLVRGGWSHGQVSTVVAGLTVVTATLGLLSLIGNLPWRIAADTTMIAIVMLYVHLARRRVPSPPHRPNTEAVS